jgi:hypothetical protein
MRWDTCLSLHVLVSGVAQSGGVVIGRAAMIKLIFYFIQDTTIILAPLWICAWVVYHVHALHLGFEHNENSWNSQRLHFHNFQIILPTQSRM